MKKNGKKNKLSSKTKIFIILGAVGIGIVAIAVTLLVIAALEKEGACPSGYHRHCAPLGGNTERCDCVKDGTYPIVDEKPIIYIYPEKETELTVRLGSPEKLTTSYPNYGDGWQVIAEPGGRLIDTKTNRELYSLYWEGTDGEFDITDDGFVVASADVMDFLEEKLALLGLSDREANEFIIYWLPKLQKNKYNYIRFASRNEIDEYMPLDIMPRPDTLIRVLMIAKPIDDSIDIPEQILGPTPERSGLTVVEWGGTLVE
ncbi:hypothetical protein IIY66_00475 [Candidatus Saccharibacteria bacterium]|nr:hypothetical protein [Candidatus Saccharibacteria bacterium]